MAGLKLKGAFILASLALSSVVGQPGSTGQNHKQPKDGGVAEFKKQLDALLTDTVARSLLEQLFDLSTSVWDRIGLAPETLGVPELENKASVSKEDDDFGTSETGTPGVEAQGQACEGGNCQRQSVQNASVASEEKPEAGEATPDRVDVDNPKDVEFTELLEPFVDHEKEAATAEPAMKDEGVEDTELVEPAQPIDEEEDEPELEVLVDPALDDDEEEEAESAEPIEPVMEGTEAHEQPCEEGDEDCQEQQSEKEASVDSKEEPKAKKPGLAKYDVDAEQKEPHCDEIGCKVQETSGVRYVLHYVNDTPCHLPLTLSSVRKSSFVKYSVPLLTKGEWKSLTTRSDILKGVSVTCTGDNRMHFVVKGTGYTPNKGGKIRHAIKAMLRRFRKEQIFERTVRMEDACDCPYPDDENLTAYFSLGFNGESFESVNIRCIPLRSFSYSFTKESSLCRVPSDIHGFDESVGKEGVLTRMDYCLFRVVANSFSAIHIEKDRIVTVSKKRSGEPIVSSIYIERDPGGLYDCLVRTPNNVKAFLRTGTYMEEGGTTPVQGQALFIYTGAKRKPGYIRRFGYIWIGK